MEQHDLKNTNEDNSSDGELIELELQDDEVNQEAPSDQLVISHLFEIGEYIDFQQPNNHKWVTMKILDIQNSNLRLQLPDSQNIFWTQFDYQTIRKQWVHGVPLALSRVDVHNPHRGWIEGVVISTEKDKAFVHHTGFKKIYDLQYPIKEIQPLGYNSTLHGMGKVLRNQPQVLLKYQHRYNLYMQIWNLLTIRKKYKEMEVSLNSVLSELGMAIQEVQGDGNCMFRAIADQLYGNEVHHKELRKFAMQYILQEKEYFSDYIINGNVEEYVEYKSKDGVWGDNIELQAFRELYDIPIEIYVCSKEPLKTGLESNPQNKEYYKIINRPIRLSYHGRSHYNSIKLKNKPHQALLGNLEVSVYEQQMLDKIKHQIQKNGQQQQVARAQFENSISNELDLIFNESKRIFQEQEQKNEQIAIKESLLEQEYEEDEEQLMDMVIQQSKQEILEQQEQQQQQQQQQQKQQQQQQQQSIENEILRQVLEQSKQEQDRQVMEQFEDTQFQNALKESEKNIYDDPLTNPVIAQVMALGYFTLEQILEGYTIHRDDPDMIINYLYENFQ